MKTVEEARAYLRTFYEQEAVQAHLHVHEGAWTRDQCVKAMDDATDDLIRAVRAEMPCYLIEPHHWHGETFVVTTCLDGFDNSAGNWKDVETGEPAPSYGPGERYCAGCRQVIPYTCPSCKAREGG